MATRSERKIPYMVYFPPEVLAAIEDATERGERSAWIVEACRKELEREYNRNRHPPGRPPKETT